MCKTRNIASKKRFLHLIINFCDGPLRVPWRSGTFGLLGDLQGNVPTTSFVGWVIAMDFLLKLVKVFYYINMFYSIVILCYVKLLQVFFFTKKNVFSFTFTKMNWQFLSTNHSHSASVVRIQLCVTIWQTLWNIIFI